MNVKQMKRVGWSIVEFLNREPGRTTTVREWAQHHRVSTDEMAAVFAMLIGQRQIRQVAIGCTGILIYGSSCRPVHPARQFFE